MNHIDQIFSQSKTLGGFAKGYFDYLKHVLDSIELSSIDALAEVFENARLKGNTIFVVGNGGSATTATTMANDLGFDVIKKLEIEKPIRVLALTDNISIMTAIANDVGYENVFVNQLRIHYRPGDKLIVISASGNSPNVVRAAEWIKAQGGTVIGFLGFDGGTIKELCDICILVKTLPGEYGPVEDAHLVLNHVLAHWFKKKFKQV